jgi:hypothetical protein
MEEHMGTGTVVYHFTITARGFDPDLLKALVLVAIKETDLVFSQARRKLETDCHLDDAKPHCAIKGGTECGDHLARLLSGFLIKQVGEDGFQVERQTGNGQKAA